MEKVRGRIKRIRHRLELPSCWRPKKDMPNLVYTVLDRECDSLLCYGHHHHHHHHHLQPLSGLDHRLGSFLNAECNTHSNKRGGYREDRRLSDVSCCWEKEDHSGAEWCGGGGGEFWSLHAAEKEGPTIRVATFDVALFSLAPAIPPDHPCAASVGCYPSMSSDHHHRKSFDCTPLHFLSSESSSIFSYKSKSTSSDASSGMTSFSTSRESSDSIETCAILSQHASKPATRFNLLSSTQQQQSSGKVFDISRVWRLSTPSSSSTSARARLSSAKCRILSPFKSACGKKPSAPGNVFHSKLNPVFGLSSNSSKSLLDSLPPLATMTTTLSDVLACKQTTGPSPLSLERSNSVEEDGLRFSPPPPPLADVLSQLDFSSEAGFHTPHHHSELACTSDCGVGEISPCASSSAASPLNNDSMSQFGSPCSNLSSIAPSVFSGASEPLPVVGSAFAAPSTILSSILDVLLEVDADIIALQEVRAEEERGMKPLSELAEALGMEYAYAESWAPEFGNAVLSRWPIKSACVQQLHDETDCRNVLKVVVEVPLAGDLHFYCTQLDHLEEDWRMKQIDSFLHMVPPSQPHIFTGNLNSLERSDYSKGRWEEIVQARKQTRKMSPRGDVMKKLVQQKGYTDAKSAVGNSKLDAELLRKGQGVEGTYQHGTRVDYILGSPKLPFSFVPGSYSVVPSRGTSNHDLVLVDLQPSYP